MSRNAKPYELPGRWFKLFLESDGSTVTITTSDIPDVEIVGNLIKLPADYHIMERYYDIHTVEHDNNVSIAIGITSTPDGCQAIQAPSAVAFDYADIYIFSHYEP